LKKLGYDASALQALREEGYLLWKGKNDKTSLLVPSADLDALFVINTLSFIVREHDGGLLALALLLILSPVHTLSACIALD
ncbi:CesT family type III secretion system chaperone, partial [Pseudomonas syringae pv. tagetis]